MTYFRGVPTFFRACCAEAARGGNLGYDHAGYELARHTMEFMDDEPKALDQKLSALDAALKAFAGSVEQSGHIIAWYEREFPRCVALVPRRRRLGFATGVLRCWMDGNSGIMW